MSSSTVWKYTTPVETAVTKASVEKSMKIMKNIITNKIDRPIGPYSLQSHGIVTNEPVGRQIFLCGQCPVLPDNSPLVGTVTEKTHLMCQNAKNALEAAGSSLDRVVKCMIFFTDITDYEESNKVYVQYFPHIPARSAMEVSKIPPKGTTMQLDIIALL